jgi:hypothetical protein
MDKYLLTTLILFFWNFAVPNPQEFSRLGYRICFWILSTMMVFFLLYLDLKGLIFWVLAISFIVLISLTKPFLVYLALVGYGIAEAVLWPPLRFLIRFREIRLIKAQPIQASDAVQIVLAEPEVQAAAEKFRADFPLGQSNIPIINSEGVSMLIDNVAFVKDQPPPGSLCWRIPIYLSNERDVNGWLNSSVYFVNAKTGHIRRPQ